MIRTEKPAEPPAKFKAKAAELTRAPCRAYEEDPEGYRSGSKRFKFDAKVNADIKNAKCCYCERKLRAAFEGDIEHYRPKSCCKQNDRQKAQFPGYYWLARTWGNLYASCGSCNRSAKGVLFPLDDPTQRARFHADDISREDPLILDPGGPEDPRNRIRFHICTAFSCSKRGRATIDVLKLNRPDLIQERLARYRTFDLLKTIVAQYTANPHFSQRGGASGL